MAQAGQKAPEDWRSPKAGATSLGTDGREASWSAPVLWRFLTGAAARNTYRTPVRRYSMAEICREDILVQSNARVCHVQSMFNNCQFQIPGIDWVDWRESK